MADGSVPFRRGQVPVAPQLGRMMWPPRILAAHRSAGIDANQAPWSLDGASQAGRAGSRLRLTAATKPVKKPASLSGHCPPPPNGTIREISVNKFLLVTDLDNTLLGDVQALKELNQRLDHSTAAHGTRIVHTTGRSLTLYRELAAQSHLQSPDALVTAVGTEIYFDVSAGVPDSAWSARLLEGWDRERVVVTAARFVDLVPQPTTEQRPYKVSYFLTAEAAASVLPRLDISLRERGLNTRMVYSSNQDLDILPARGGKGLAMQYVRNQWGFDAKRTVACGDSGNDIDLFSTDRELGIIVGNAQPELLEWYQANSADHLYLATAHYAAGILEGLHHFGFLAKNENSQRHR